MASAGTYFIRTSTEQAAGYLSVRDDGRATLEIRPRLFHLEPIFGIPEAGPYDRFQIKASAMGQLQVLATLKADYGAAGAEAGDVIGDPDAAVTFAWHIKERNGAFTITATENPNAGSCGGAEVFLVWNGTAVTWQLIQGGIVGAPPVPSNALWLLEHQG